MRLVDAFNDAPKAATTTGTTTATTVTTATSGVGISIQGILDVLEVRNVASSSVKAANGFELIGRRESIWMPA